MAQEFPSRIALKASIAQRAQGFACRERDQLVNFKDQDAVGEGFGLTPRI
jgi:hypothetical protein